MIGRGAWVRAWRLVSGRSPSCNRGTSPKNLGPRRGVGVLEFPLRLGMLYADVEYFGIKYLDAEFVDGKWYYERRIGEVYDFLFQDRVKLLNEPQDKPRHRKKILHAVRLFGVTRPMVTAHRWRAPT